MLFRRSKSLTPSQAASAMNSGKIQLVDVRGGAELAESRVEGAKHIPLSALSGRLDELDGDRPVAFLCRTGRRSAVATHRASKAGLDVANVRGGVLAWAKAGLPLASGSHEEPR